jgi:photosystem II stability/assembly factor-like uncharacterized protein
MKNHYFISICLLVVTASFAQKKKSTPPSAKQVLAQEIVSTSASERMAGYEQRKKLDAISLVNNVKFRSIGPTNMSGRVVDLDVNEANPTHFFVAYASGGLWKTENNGMSFTPLFDNEASMTIGEIAVDWKTNGQTIWVGTGENNSSRSTYAGTGVYKTNDGGKTWQHVGLEDTHHIGQVILHPTDPNTVWVAAVGHLYSPNTERGIYKTTDGGKTWKKTLYIDDKTGAIDLDIDPSNPAILYASMWYKERRAWNFVEGGKTSGIYKSTDGGETWKLLTTENSGFPTGDGNGRIGLSIYPKNPNLIYAFIDNQARRKETPPSVAPTGITARVLKGMTKDDFLKFSEVEINEFLDGAGFPEKYNAKKIREQISTDKITVKNLYDYVTGANDELISAPISGAEVYRSEDGGQTWKKTHDEPIDAVFTYGYYFGKVFVSADNPDRIIIYGVPILQSMNGGKTWKSLDASNVHSDHHALWFNPKNADHILIGNDGGLNLTYDGGKNWSHLNPIPVGQFYAISVDMEKPYNVYGGLQDNGVWWGTSQPGEELRPWKSIMGGDGMQVQVDWRDNTTVYTGLQFGNYFKVNKNTYPAGMKRLQMPASDIGEAKLRFNWQAPIVLSRHNQDIVYFGSNKFHRSLDKGETFQTLSEDLTKGSKEGDVPFGTLTTLDESPKKFGLLYAGTDDGLVHISKDGGYTWTKISDALPQNLWVSRVVASAHNESTVLVSLNGYRDDNFKPYLYLSLDYGQNWQAIGTDLPLEPINVVREDPKNANILYVGTDNGVYVSLNKGKTFTRMSGNLPAVAVHDLIVHPRDNELVVGTHGRSIYVGDVSLIQQLADTLINKDLHLFALKSLNYTPSWGRMFDKYSEPRVQKYEIPFYVRAATKSSIKIQTEKGLTLRTLNDDSEAGLNFANFDLSIDTTAKVEYEKVLNAAKKKDDKEIKLAKADDGKIYIRAGKYKVVVETATGTKAEQSFEIKAAERRPSRRSNAFPTNISTPGDFEEWMEESGLEGKK